MPPAAKPARREQEARQHPATQHSATQHSAVTRGRAKAGTEASRPVLERSLALLEAVARSERPPTQAQLADELDLPRPTAWRIFRRLEADGYLVHEPGGRLITIGPKLLRLGLDIVSRAAVATERHRILQQLVDEIGETCNFNVLSGAEILYLDRVESRWPLRSTLEIGSRVPIHCTATGKLLLAMLEATQRRRLLARLELTALTAKSTTDAAVLERELAAIRRRGYATDNEEFMAGLGGIAVAVRDSKGVAVAALACHAPLSRLTVDALQSHLPKLRRASERMAATLP